ncbi:MAG: hypothetical protein ACLSE8_05875 [Parasutterella sp.]
MNMSVPAKPENRFIRLCGLPVWRMSLTCWALLTPTSALSGKTFLDNLQWAPLPEGKQLLRSTWVVGDSFNREQQVDLVCKLAQEALKDKFAPHIKNFAPGLANYIEIVSQD